VTAAARLDAALADISSGSLTESCGAPAASSNGKCDSPVLQWHENQICAGQDRKKRIARFETTPSREIIDVGQCSMTEYQIHA